MPDLTPEAAYWLDLRERYGNLPDVLWLAERIARQDGRAVVCRNDLEAAQERIRARLEGQRRLSNRKVDNGPS